MSIKGGIIKRSNLRRRRRSSLTEKEGRSLFSESVTSVRELTTVQERSSRACLVCISRRCGGRWCGFRRVLWAYIECERPGVSFNYVLGLSSHPDRSEDRKQVRTWSHIVDPQDGFNQWSSRRNVVGPTTNLRLKILDVDLDSWEHDQNGNLWIGGRWQCRSMSPQIYATLAQDLPIEKASINFSLIAWNF